MAVKWDKSVLPDMTAQNKCGAVVAAVIREAGRRNDAKQPRR
jgi:hypothetical protein